MTSNFISSRSGLVVAVATLSLLSLLSLFMAACDTSKPGAASSIALADCRLKRVDTLARCAIVSVPEDHSNFKNGKTINIHLAVLPSLARHPESDPVYFFAGGPGQAASDIAFLAAAFGDVRKHRDIILVDQRGTGKSKTLSCEAGVWDARLDPLAQALTATDADMDRDRARCLVTLKGNAATHRTDDYIDDLELVRKALGHQKINVWGGSYGSRVALRYMKRFPDRIRAAVLDGVAPTTLHLPDDALLSSEAELRTLLAACNASAACSKAYPDSLASFDQLTRTLKAKPAPVRMNHPGSGKLIDATVSDRTVVSLLWPLLYQPEAQRLIPSLIAQAATGNFAPLAATATASAITSEELAMALRMAVMCAEDMLGRTATANPRFEALSSVFYAACKDFPHGKVAAEFFEPTVSAIPTLLFSGSHDPVTPPSQAALAAKTLSQHKQVLAAGMGHIVSTHACVRRIIGKFIDAGTITAANDPCEAELTLPRPLFYASPLEARP